MSHVFRSLLPAIALVSFSCLPMLAQEQLPVPVCQVKLNSSGTAFINTGSVDFPPLPQKGSVLSSPHPSGFPAYNISGAGFLLDNENCPVTAKAATIVFTSRPLSQTTGGMLFGFRFGRGIDNKRFGFSALNGNMTVRHFDYAVTGEFRRGTTLLQVPENAPAWTTYILTVTPKQMILRSYDSSGTQLAESRFDEKTPPPHRESSYFLPDASLNLPVFQSGIYGVGQNRAKDRLIAVISAYDRILTLEQQKNIAAQASHKPNKNASSHEQQNAAATSASPAATAGSSSGVWIIAGVGGLVCVLSLAGLLCIYRRR